MTSQATTIRAPGRTDCVCMNPPFHYTIYTKVDFGTDDTHGRYGEVSVLTCNTCGTKWLEYYVEYEAFSRSGRWYKGIVTDDQIASLAAERAVEFLDSLPWYFCGGSFFGSSGDIGAKRVGLTVDSRWPIFE